MYHLKVLLLFAIQNWNCCVATLDEREPPHTTPLLDTIQKNLDQQRDWEGLGGQWVALGDSFSAGPGAGSSLETNVGCARHSRGYPQQLQSDAWWPGSPRFGHPLQFLSCNGATIANITETQVPQMLKLGDSKIITISVGANDALFSKILLKCLMNLGDGTCDEALKAGREKLYGMTLWDQYRKLVLELTEKTGWSKQAINERKPLIYHTAYPALFDDNTTQCDEVTFNPSSTSATPKLSQELRRKLNLYIAEVNVMIAFWIAHVNQQYESLDSKNYTSPIYFVDQDAEYTGHRFCRNVVTEPDTENFDTWFNNTKLVDLGATASDFAGTNAKTCLATAGDRMDLLYKCYISNLAAQNSNFDFSTAIRADKQASLFHPATAGMAGVAKAASEAIRLPALETKPWLRIMATGDSITRGSGSPDTGGWRNYLDTLLVDEMGDFEWIGSVVNGTKPNLEVSQLPNEGYGSYEIAGLHDILIQSNSTLDKKPNLVLLMIGTNDIWRDRDVTETTRSLEKLMKLIWLRSGDDTLIIVSTVVPIAYEKSIIFPMAAPQKRVNEYNSQIKNLVNEFNARGKNINLMHTPISQNDQYDLLHPTPRGYEKIAHSWFRAITKAAHNGQIPERQAPENTTDAKDDPEDNAQRGATDEKPSGGSGISVMSSWSSIGPLVFGSCGLLYML